MSSGGGKGASGGGSPWGAAVGLGLGLGQSWASNPNIGAGSNGPSLFGQTLADRDPFGSLITKFGGDPLNLYGHKNNPNALLFPSQNQNGMGIPGTLPNLGINAQMPHGSFNPINTSGGPFNAMANMSAGNLFNPSGGGKGPGSPQMMPGGGKGPAPMKTHPPGNGRLGGGY